jgi:hypothetical protein
MTMEVTMYKKRQFLLPMVLLILMVFPPLQASGLKKIAQTGMKWISIPMGARAAAMGTTFTACADDAGSVFWNPAGIAYSAGGHLFLNQTKWIADITLSSGALSYNLENWGTVGLSFASVDWGTLHGTRRSNNELGFEQTDTFSPTDMAVGLSYGRRISAQFAVGGHLKYVYEELGSSLEGAMDNSKEFNAQMGLFAFDFGTIYHTGYKSLKIGMVLQNFSEEAKYRAEQFPLPLTFKFGLAMNVLDFWLKDGSEHRLTVAIDAVHPRDYSERMHFGLEYGFMDMVFLRGGYKTNYDEESVSFGGGIRHAFVGLQFDINYAYLQFKNFDAVQMFSFDFNF